MPLSLIELVDSRESTVDVLTGQATSIVMHYILRGTDNDLTAKATLLSSTASTYDGLVRADVALRPIYVDTVNSVGEWECEVRYVQYLYEEGESTYQFQIGGQQAKLYHTEHVSDHGRAGDNSFTIPNYSGLIGVNPDGSVEGIEIDSPVYEWSETHYLSAATVEASGYKAGLFALKLAPVNNASFRGFAAGEVRFLHASGGFRRSLQKYEMNFAFAASPNLVDYSVDLITGINKTGWEYMWIEFETVKVGKVKVQRPRFVHIERPYKSSSFGVLGIGS